MKHLNCLPFYPGTKFLPLRVQESSLHSAFVVRNFLFGQQFYAHHVISDFYLVFYSPVHVLYRSGFYYSPCSLVVLCKEGTRFFVLEEESQKSLLSCLVFERASEKGARCHESQPNLQKVHHNCTGFPGSPRPHARVTPTARPRPDRDRDQVSVGTRSVTGLSQGAGTFGRPRREVAGEHVGISHGCCRPRREVLCTRMTRGRLECAHHGCYNLTIFGHGIRFSREKSLDFKFLKKNDDDDADLTGLVCYFFEKTGPFRRSRRVFSSEFCPWRGSRLT